MPFVTTSLARGKSRECLGGVSSAVHQALVQELGMNSDDRSQLIETADGNFVRTQIYADTAAAVKAAR